MAKRRFHRAHSSRGEVPRGWQKWDIVGTRAGPGTDGHRAGDDTGWHSGGPPCVSPCNTADITAFRYAVADLRGRFAVLRVVVVADRGVVSEPLLKALNQEEVGYIVGVPLKKWRAAERVLRRAGRYHI